MAKLFVMVIPSLKDWKLSNEVVPSLGHEDGGGPTPSDFNTPGSSITAQVILRTSELDCLIRNVADMILSVACMFVGAMVVSSE